MDVSAFVDKWRKSSRSERSASQEHFYDLCDLLGHPKPGDVDAKGESFTAERRVKKASGKQGFADFFKKGFFAWEYKKKGADLNEAFNQLLQYSGDLGNPPLFVASDMDRIEIRTHFTGYPTTSLVVTLADFAKPASQDILRRLFYEPETFQPEKTIQQVTEEAAGDVAEVIDRIRKREAANPARKRTDAIQLARFLDRVVFCMFAEDIGLLPEKLFSRILEKYTTRASDRIVADIGQLFHVMAHGGEFWGNTIPHFDGNLFDDTPPVELLAQDVEVLYKASQRDWGAMDPSILGTLFERVMDDSQRAQLGAHYTGYDDISTLVEPVVMTPLRREWAACSGRIRAILPDVFDPSDAPNLFTAARTDNPGVDLAAARKEAQSLLAGFLKHLRSVRVLDPACGSGNFLYVALKKLKDLEYDALVFCRHHELPEFPLEVGPQQLRGIETNPYAHDLAQMTVWIGFLQWHRARGFPYDHDPILQPLDTIEHKDAILDASSPKFPAEPPWPDADFIIGNPPFLGGKKLRTELGDEYVDRLFALWGERVRPEADLCCYWFEKARHQIQTGKCRRAGLLATQGIRGGANRETLQRIKQTGDIFFAVSDRNWFLDGAMVHVSMVGFDDGSETSRALDDKSVPSINPNLTSATDITQSRRLAANLNVGFMGDTKGGSFDITERLALGFMDRPNPNGRPNSDVIVPWINGLDVTRRNRNEWIIDFGVNTSMQDASGYERPFEYLREKVLPTRSTNKRQAYKERWWIHVEPRPAMRSALSARPRFLVTPRVAKHRLFVWMEAPTLPDCQLIAFARSDDYFLGIVQSRAHETWARAQGTQVRERESGFRYTPTTCFETFPLPEPTPAQHDAIAQAAKRLDDLRSNWLTPPEWHRETLLEFPGAIDGPWSRFVHDPNAKGIGAVRYPRLVPKDAYLYDLAKRTLTNLYNERPTWLDLAHRDLDAAVFAAYGWKPDLSDDQLLAALLELNLERSSTSEPAPPPAEDGEDE